MAVPYSFDKHLFTPGIERLLEFARPRPNERVLDLAAGSGIAARRCGRIVGPDGFVTSLDIGPNILKKARAKYDAPAAAGWSRGDALALPFVDDSFDLVVCHQGLQFFSDRPAAVGGLRRILRPGGRAAVMTWAALQECPFYLALHAAILEQLGEPAAGFVRQPFTLPTSDQLVELFAEDFTQVKVSPIIVDTVHPSAAAFATAFLSYLPPSLATRDQVTAATRAIAGQVEKLLLPWCVDGQLHAPISAHVTIAS